MINQTNWKEVTGVEPYVMWKGYDSFVYFHTGDKCWYLDRYNGRCKEDSNGKEWHVENKDQMIILTPQAKPTKLIDCIEHNKEFKLSLPYNSHSYIIENEKLYFINSSGKRREADIDTHDLLNGVITYIPEKPTYPEIMKKAEETEYPHFCSQVDVDLAIKAWNTRYNETENE